MLSNLLKFSAILFVISLSFGVEGQIYSEDFSTDNGAGYNNNVYTAPVTSSWSMVLVGAPDVNGTGDYVLYIMVE